MLLIDVQLELFLVFFFLMKQIANTDDTWRAGNILLNSSVTMLIIGKS